MANDNLFLDKLIKRHDDKISEIDDKIQKLMEEKQSIIERKEKMILKFQHKNDEELSNEVWDKPNFEWSVTLMNVIQKCFKIQKLKPFQLSAMNAILSERDCLLIMPTGGGKSLCFQAPAIISEGITVVVSPLIALMQEQCMTLKLLGINATMITANIKRVDIDEIYKNMLDAASTLKLLYVTPERLTQKSLFMTKLQKMYDIGRFKILAIDEVHCCTEWGHTFRKDYKLLGNMKEQFPKITIIGLTATAPIDIQYDVQETLKIEDCLTFKVESNRPNLKYEVRCKLGSFKQSANEIAYLIKSRYKDMSGIIYCRTIKEVIKMTKELQDHGINARGYYAALDSKERSDIYFQWIEDKIQVIVATVALGMGINKLNVRFVIHHAITQSLEHYYQESGRAGRDNKDAECICFFQLSDMFKQSPHVSDDKSGLKTGLEKLYDMVSYCVQSKRCRKAVISYRFDTKMEADNCGKMCDWCCSLASDLQKVDITVYYNTLSSILEEAESTDKNFTGIQLMELWMTGKHKNDFEISWKPPLLTRQQCELIIAFLVTKNYFIEDFQNNISYIKIGPTKVNAGPITLTFLKSTIV